MLFSSLVVYCFLYYYVHMKLSPLWEAVKLERNPFSEDNFLVFLLSVSGDPFNIGMGVLFPKEAPADLEITSFIGTGK